jgi:hypothetical protein
MRPRSAGRAKREADRARAGRMATGQCASAVRRPSGEGFGGSSARSFAAVKRQSRSCFLEDVGVDCPILGAPKCTGF